MSWKKIESVMTVAIMLWLSVLFVLVMGGVLAEFIAQLLCAA